MFLTNHLFLVKRVDGLHQRVIVGVAFPADRTRDSRVGKTVGLTDRSTPPPRQCRDNAVAELFFATIKAELLDRRGWPSRTTARKAIFEYIEGWYNTRRLHSSLGYLDPNTYEPNRHATEDRVVIKSWTGCMGLVTRRQRAVMYRADHYVLGHLTKSVKRGLRRT
ncbi:integrase core domain-containing protein [Amycolatopsis speibonae]|uniref:Integrase core domain-containing protein n=1 Tax=Amycolatopsis speibonae TaxID=1450224 RepID=A0ABV7PEZ8_9PSEU